MYVSLREAEWVNICFFSVRILMPVVSWLHIFCYTISKEQLYQRYCCCWSSFFPFFLQSTSQLILLVVARSHSPQTTKKKRSSYIWNLSHTKIFIRFFPFGFSFFWFVECLCSRVAFLLLQSPRLHSLLTFTSSQFIRVFFSSSD